MQRRAPGACFASLLGAAPRALMALGFRAIAAQAPSPTRVALPSWLWI